MATVRWRGDQKNVAQINTITPASVTIGNTFSVTINGKSITFTATAATVANVTAGLVALLNASVIPEFAEITWTDSTTKITATADTAGKPFTQTSSSADGTGSAGHANVTATATACVSCNDANDAANWSGGSLPTNSDDVFIQDSSVSLLYNLGSLSAVTLTSLTIDDTFTGDIGLPQMTDSGYYEYRATEFAIGATTCTIGRNDSSGSGRIRLNFGSVQTTLNILDTGSASSTGDYAVRWRGTHASNVVNIVKGELGIAPDAGQTAAIATLNIGYVDSQDQDVKLYAGSGVTLTTVNMNGGQVVIAGGTAAATTINQTAGDLTIYNGTVTTLAVDGGVCNYHSAGTVTTAAVGSDATLDCSQNVRTRTITTLKLYKGATFLDPFRTCTLTNGAQLFRCAIKDVTLDLGEHVQLVPTALSV